MGALQHSIQKKQHRERSQVQERSRFGFLEKHKDYVKRAQDYHKKEKTLKVLKSKAKERNPDEFYYGMNSKRVDEDGLLVTSRHGASEDDGVLTMDQVKLLKTQDSNYVRTMRLVEKRKAEKKREQVLFNGTGKHTVFVEDAESLESFSPEEYFKTSSEMLGRRSNRLREEQLVGDLHLDKAEYSESLRKKKVKKLRAITKHMERESQLAGVEQRMNMQREVMKSGSKKKIEVGEGASKRVVYKWKKQRKR
ncbi:U3 small nucleolar RNA-associated protein 11 [Kluyveromyces marxianus]|uniref:U3 small nucleolar RNA-associated protein 11 n=1 Tax=Kluyveromyces marxianus TaxID=4911 RepID=A0ABX6EPZ6_KLUMA|nr:U3 small nucleolar RNA-associated protein 11 [Kluyveromyces marxianus]